MKKRGKIKLFSFGIFILIISEILNYYPNVLETTKIDGQYTVCMKKQYDESELDEELNNKINEIDYYIRTNYKASIVYEDAKTSFHYEYNPDTVYYGASLIKIVEAMYLFDEATVGNINLDSRLTYYSKYVVPYSEGMSKKNIGDEVSLKELISYALMYSDNSAHFMLSDYIGKDNIIAYGKKLGAQNILTGEDTFGNQSATDTNIYLKHAYEIISSGSEYGKLLKRYMANTHYNSLYLGEKNNVAHKYGWYQKYYHDIGIVYEEHPYFISILTNHGNENFKEIVRDIHKKINELHRLFYEKRKTICLSQ